MQGYTKSNFPLVVGIGLPVIILVGLFLFAFLLPNFFIHPSYNFLYEAGDSYYDRNFQVENQILVFRCTGNEYRDCDRQMNNASFYIYDVAKNANVSTSFSEAQKLKLDPSDVSPDGYRFVATNEGGGFGFFPIFWDSSSSRGHAFQKGWLRKTLELKSRSYHNNNVQFLGWILP